MKKQKGITLIALVISIIVMLILAGVSINAIVGENGVLTKAQNAKLASEEAARLEELELILFEYNSSEFLGESDGFAAFLADKKADGIIQDYIYLDNLIIKYKDKYYEAETDGEYYSVNGEMEDDLTAGGSGGVGDNYIITPDNLTTNNMEFQAGSSYVVLDKVSGEDFNFAIPAGDPITIKLVGDMTIDNKGYKRSAIDLAEGATLNLYVYGNVEVNSGYGEDANADIPGEGGYAGIHVPENATLNLYGTGSLTAIGGNAGSGEVSTQSVLTAGGGGAGAGIGGHGGAGGAGANGIYDDSARVCENGKDGENCGNVNIYNSITIYAYGGAGGSGGINIVGCSGGAGGYPAAGIGGGGAGGAGSTCCTGAGGYTGGGASNYPTRAVNGMYGGECTRQAGMYWGGGGYFSGPEGQDLTGIDVKTCFGGMGGTSYYQGHRAGDGGNAGSGGTIKVSETANVYAYNGNRYTDGTDYANGLNQCPIYIQNGIKPTRYEVLSYATHDYGPHEIYGLTNGITLGITSAFANNVTKSGYVNKAYENVESQYKTITINTLLTDVDMSKQGIGSGAGYVEVSNGTYTVDSSMN